MDLISFCEQILFITSAANLLTMKTFFSFLFVFFFFPGPALLGQEGSFHNASAEHAEISASQSDSDIHLKFLSDPYCDVEYAGPYSNSYNMTKPYWLAHDYYQEDNNFYNLERLTIEVLTYGEEPSLFDLEFFISDYELPTTSIYSVQNVSPDEMEIIGYENGSPRFEVKFDFLPDEVYMFGEDVHFWVAVSAHPTAGGGDVFWVHYPYEYSYDELPMIWNPGNGDWAFYGDVQGYMKLEGTCGWFHEWPSCDLDFNTVEPITRFKLTDIDNVTDAGINGSPAVETFDLIAEVEKTRSYEVIIEGNTNGNHTDYFTLFLEIPSDESWEEYITFNLGTLTDSDGVDGKQLIAEFTPPGDLYERTYRIAILKNRGTYPTDPCGSYSFGQAEKYKIDLKKLSTLEVEKEALEVYPNPVKDFLYLKNSDKVQSLSVYDVSGKKLKTFSQAENKAYNLSGFTPGAYIIRLHFTDGSEESIKILKD